MSVPSLRGVVVDVARVRTAASALRSLASARSHTHLADGELKRALARQRSQADTADESRFAYVVSGLDVRGDQAEEALTRAIRILGSWAQKAASAQEQLDEKTGTALSGSN